MTRLGEDVGLDRIVLAGGPLSIADVVAVARGRASAELGDGGRARMAPAREVVERLVAEGRQAYGVSTGEGLVGGERAPAAEGLRRAGLSPLTLSYKEGLSLVNGTEGMLALACLAVADAEALAATADVACAMSIEGLLGTDRPFQARVHELRPHPGQRDSAANLRRLLAGSPILASHRHSDHAIQDAYSLRCAPQVHGACRDVVAFARGVAERELGSVTDNPVVFADSA